MKMGCCQWPGNRNSRVKKYRKFSVFSFVSLVLLLRERRRPSKDPAAQYAESIVGCGPVSNVFAPFRGACLQGDSIQSTLECCPEPLLAVIYFFPACY